MEPHLARRQVSKILKSLLLGGRNEKSVVIVWVLQSDTVVRRSVNAGAREGERTQIVDCECINT